MTELINHNPDVLSCLANLSNDEVFTSVDIVNDMLDLLPTDIWKSPDIKFLDPCCKSGVFLREIIKRLIKGLENEIVDLQQRIDHICREQVYGIAITELTSLLSKRSAYCSKSANGNYSICSSFDDAEGNIIFKPISHTWAGEKCVYCGIGKMEFERSEELESHAYMFIHTIKPEELFGMKFDVIIGNPPYQLETGGSGRQAKPIYPLFVEQAKKLDPTYLVMIIPSRWFAGGMGLEKFRSDMLSDRKIMKIVDYSNAKDCFPSNSVSGGVHYFIRDKNYDGDCTIVNINNGIENEMLRPLNEFPILIRYNKAVDIVRKVTNSPNFESLSSIASSLTPFGLPTNCRGHVKKFDGDLILHSSEGISYIFAKDIQKGQEYVKNYKVLVSKTGAEHAGEPDKDGMYRVLTTSMKTIGPDEVCTHSYFVIGNFASSIESDNLCNYLKTKFVRFLVLQSMTSINVSKSVMLFVPKLDYTIQWTDEDLYKRYNLNDDEIKFIESLIRNFNTEV